MTDTPREQALTPRQQRFVEEYLIDLNATQAAIRAGYSGANADKIGPRLVGKSRVAAAIADGIKARAERQRIEADRVLEELAIVGFSDVSHYELDGDGEVIVAAGAPETAMRAIHSVKTRKRRNKDGTTSEVEIRLWDKVSALEKLARHLGMFDRNGAPAEGLTIRVVRE